jgi:hypothetical protein
MEEWSGKEKVMKQGRKLREKKETERIFIDNDLTSNKELSRKKKNSGDGMKKGGRLEIFQ